MKHIDQDNIKNRNEKILILLDELNSTLDLYYETGHKNDFIINEK